MVVLSFLVAQFYFCLVPRRSTFDPLFSDIVPRNFESWTSIPLKSVNPLSEASKLSLMFLQAMIMAVADWAFGGTLLGTPRNIVGGGKRSGAFVLLGVSSKSSPSLRTGRSRMLRSPVTMRPWARGPLIAARCGNNGWRWKHRLLHEGSLYLRRGRLWSLLKALDHGGEGIHPLVEGH